ncbi:glycosyltransferase [Patulibacter americanus]|uniref:glycosyltransferase n=1 Tax=Patulibacter americanus TaxID=588672 RepID=UPI0003B34781|nr:glycosyltransferase [Patulibacter americanus]
MPTPDPGAVPDGTGRGDLAGLRVLAISSLYPPHHLGGYELLHREVDEELRARGIDLRVLATDHEEPDARHRGSVEPPDVHRELRSYWRDHAFPRMTPGAVLALERHNHRVLHRHLEEHRPDVVAFWAMGGMSLSLLGAVRTAGLPAVHVVHDRWPVFGPQFDRFARGIRPLGPARGALARRLGSDRPRRPEGTVLVTAAALADELRRVRAVPADARVVPVGVDVPDELPPAPLWRGRLLGLGRLDPRSGADRVIAAAAVLGPAFRMTLAGEAEPAVARALRERADESGVGPRLTLSGRVDPAALRDLLEGHDVAIFPSTLPGGTGLAVLHAMAHGVPVIAADVDGYPAALRDGRDALLVPPGDTDALAATVRRLQTDPELRSRLRDGGRATALLHDAGRFRRDVADAIVDAAHRRAGG